MSHRVAAFVKHPDEVVDYPVDWTLDEGDVITASTWDVAPSGLVATNPIFTTTKTVAWFSGGTANVEYTVTNHVTTQGGRQFDQTIIILVLE